MKTLKNALSLTLALALSLALAVPTLAWESWQDGQDYMTAFSYYKENHMLTASADPIGATTHTNVYEIDGTYDEEVVDVYIFPENTTFTPCENWSWTGYSDLGAEVGTRNTVTLTGTDVYYLGMIYLDPNNGSLGKISFYLTAADSTTPTTPTQPEQPTTPTTPVTPDAPGSYTVKKGDTWSSICMNYYGTNAQRYALMRANKGVALKEGAVITLPEKLGKDTLIPAPVAGAGEKLYVVKAGDTLGKIAAAEYGKVSEYKTIFERNADRLKNANTIYVGQVIVLPAKK